MKWLLILTILFIAFCYHQYKYPRKAVMDMATGIVKEDPQSLADAAGCELEVYSLARVGQSEEGLSSDRAKIAVMYATKNHSRRIGKSITATVTAGNPKRSDYADANGRYGRQGIHPYCTTIAAPKPHTIELAQAVYDGTANDETCGAEYWDNPIAQAKLFAAGLVGKGPEEIAERREASGLTQLNLSGISTRFWVRS